MPNEPIKGRQSIGPGYTILSYRVVSWCPTMDGSGPATAVGLILDVGGVPPLVMRLKTRQAVDDMIAALQTHRDDVFPAT
jgi:hypothetical protein